MFLFPSCSKFHWLRCGILHFFCRWCFHGDICDKKWPLFGFLKKSEKSIFWTWKYDFFWTPSTSFYYIGLEPCPSVNSGRKRFVNPIKIELTRSVRMETTLGKAPAIYNGHQPPRAVYPYRQSWDLFDENSSLVILLIYLRFG